MAEDGPTQHRSHDSNDLPVNYIDDRRYFRGYAILAVTAEQSAALHRRMVADVNGEYDIARRKRNLDTYAIRTTMATSLVLTIVEAVRISTGH